MNGLKAAKKAGYKSFEFRYESAEFEYETTVGTNRLKLHF